MMLVESFVAAISAPPKAIPNAPHKDAGIFFHDFQPQAAVRSTFKKSSTRANGVAVSSTHVFAAQTDKSVVNVYNRERGNQEALFPFKDKVTSLALLGGTGDAGILAIGNEGGRVILCELCTGRQISTPATHTQAIECMVVDRTNNFLLTGSSDSDIRVWSVPTLLSFSNSSSSYDSNQPPPFSPIHQFSNHRAAITSLVVGHSYSKANIAVSTSRDKTCIVWDYQQGKLLHTFILAGTPLCASLDPADRALYVGFEDGSVQLVDFFKSTSSENVLYDPKQTDTPTQPPDSDKWQLASDPSAILSMDLSHDGTLLLTGHENGKIQQWDTAGRRSHGSIVADFNAPVTNILMQYPSGFLKTTTQVSTSINIVKPSLEIATVSDDGSDLPKDYTYRAQFSQSINLPRFSSRLLHPGHGKESDDLMEDFDMALYHTSLPIDLVEEGLQTLTAPSENIGGDIEGFLKSWQTDPRRDVIVAQNALSASQLSNQSDNKLIEELSVEVKRLQDAERLRKRNQKLRRVRKEKFEEVQRKKAMGEDVSSDIDMEHGHGNLDTSSDDMMGGE